MKFKLVLLLTIAVLLFSASACVRNKYKVTDKTLDEVSGIAAGRVNPGLYYVHNDSGGKPEVYVLNSNGKKVHTVSLPLFPNRDWEDIAVGPGPEAGVNYIYVGEIGDNKAIYPAIVLYRFRELHFASGELKKSKVTTIREITPLVINFEDGAKDCETLMLDPDNGDVYLVSKREQKVGLYQIKAPLSTDSLSIARRILDLDFPLAVGGDISPQRDKVIIKTYDKVYCWSVEPGQEIKDALSKPPTELPYKMEPQGEAVCWSADGKSYLTISERAKKQPLYLFTYPAPTEK